jgi:hypothetical protein
MPARLGVALPHLPKNLHQHPALMPSCRSSSSNSVWSPRESKKPRAGVTDRAELAQPP